MKLIYALALCLAIPAGASSAATYKCAMTGDAVSPELYVKLLEGKNTAVLFDGGIQRFIGFPVGVEFRRFGSSRVKFSWSYRIAHSPKYKATLRTDTGKINLSIMSGGVHYLPRHFGAKGTCEPVQVSFLDDYIDMAPEPEAPAVAVCPADGSMPEQDGTWSSQCHVKSYRKRHRISCATYPCW